jgi:hypothetical protein
MSREITTSEIQKKICKEEVLKGNIPCENIGHFVGEHDVLSILKSGLIAEYEVKVSRSDFIADAKKDKWKHHELEIFDNLPNYFYYACPIGLISTEEIPNYSGLVYVSKNGVEVVKRPKKIHSIKHEQPRLLKKMCRIKSERKYLGCALLTYNNNKIKERNKATSTKNNQNQHH